MLLTHMPIVWVALLILFAVIEGVTAGLVSIWFAIGALAALLVSLACGNVAVQGAVFVVVSLLAMALLRPLGKKKLTPKHTATNADRIIGGAAVVQVPIDPVNGTGQVKVDGKVWSARTEGKEVIPEGTLVTITGIQGVRVTVVPGAVESTDSRENA